MRGLVLLKTSSPSPPPTPQGGEGAKPAQMAHVLVFAPTGASLEEMVVAFGARWTVEQCFEEGKGVF